jgi:hypothetical protein
MTAIRVTDRRCRVQTAEPGSSACPTLGAILPVRSRGTGELWASYRNKIEAGCCAGCALAATTAAPFSATLEVREHEQERSGIVDELTEIEAEVAESEEGARIYAWRVEQLSGLGLSQMIASAVASFVDWHEIAGLVERGCSPELALEIVR